MARTQLKQYADTIIVSTDELDELAKAMEDILEYGIIEMDDNKLEATISITAALAGLVFKLSRIGGIVVGVIGLVTSLSTDLRSDLERNIRKAIKDMHDTRRFMKRNGYSKVKIEYPFMDYKNMRLITGKGEALRVLGDRWEDL
ncbi:MULTISPECIES: hypothetical protein [Brevibacillus]|jgi:hypothetical protein|uniref:Uncharacterized protein n=1 Tax=Brevibacillus parabrevis TaxID=54914 RepID=A0A4Y3PIC2_BREPA|nr:MULTISPECIES: hypothetical protein [Brevibacillus]MBU8715240.1 hypothetical protein [Brevibacillus parabrevis]MDH6353570.1 hypothetical protein [Brevibacillus sp. 1238]MDR4999825.1 hypothetical protein [Brevibacillus parabrevis]RNB93759.1 hypothetical protein EDM60_19720 [Brevibacillus parabrevis]WDV96094.1 hypothetical protein PSE45_03815 [Brevibacillus parabrevis]